MKKAAVFFANGFEEVESLTVVDYLRRAGVHTDMISTIDTDFCIGAHNVDIKMDIHMSNIDVYSYDAYIIPGGSNNALSMRKNTKLLDILKKADKDKKIIASICAGPTVLYDAGILYGRNITSYPNVFREGQNGFNYIEEKVVIDDNMITSRGPALTVFFVLEIIEKLLGKEKKNDIERQILLEIM